jgi:hypothetical protein
MGHSEEREKRIGTSMSSLLHAERALELAALLELLQRWSMSYKNARKWKVRKCKEGSVRKS